MINPEQVAKIAALARLSLTEAEIKKMTEELGQILKFVEKLNELDLKGVEATSHAVSVGNVFREDKAVNAGVIGKALEEAPECDERFFKVPKVI